MITVKHLLSEYTFRTDEKKAQRLQDLSAAVSFIRDRNNRHLNRYCLVNFMWDGRVWNADILKSDDKWFLTVNGKHFGAQFDTKREATDAVLRGLANATLDDSEEREYERAVSRLRRAMNDPKIARQYED